jgi:hypothetical protein
MLRAATGRRIGGMLSLRRVPNLRATLAKRASTNQASTKPPQAEQSYFKREHIPAFGICVGIVALTVQVFLLYPWHYELSSQFNELQVG